MALGTTEHRPSVKATTSSSKDEDHAPGSDVESLKDAPAAGADMSRWREAGWKLRRVQAVLPAAAQSAAPFDQALEKILQIEALTLAQRGETRPGVDSDHREPALAAAPVPTYGSCLCLEGLSR